MASWIQGNRYLTTSEMQNNVKIIFDYLSNKGWSINAISGMLGNMQRESTINPAIWQSLIVGSGGGGGFGLVQWTPYTNFTNWADANGYEWEDGNAQLKWIDEQTTVVGQWIPTTTYNFSFAAFKTSKESPEYLASAFCFNFERAGEVAESERRSNARNWYTYLEEYVTDNNNSEVIEKAINWAVGIANDDSHGYEQGTGDQSQRWGPDYDCSSLLIQAYENAGIPVKTNGALSTHNMESVFSSCGFTSFSFTSESALKRGDVLLRDGHTAMYIGDGKIVSAHINENGEVSGGQTGDQTGHEIDVSSFSSSGSWITVLRLQTTGGGDTPITPPINPPTYKKYGSMSKLLLYTIAADED